MDTPTTNKNDRKEYWKQYQRERYARLKARQEQAYKKATLNLDQYRQAVKDQGLEGQRNWRARKKLRMHLLGSIDKAEALDFIYKRAKASAVDRNIEFTIEPSDIRLVSKCPILGVPLEYLGLGSKESIYKPSLDRVDNLRGYVPGNVQVVSARANVLKRDATLEELVLLGQWAKKEQRRSLDSHQILTDAHPQKS